MAALGAVRAANIIADILISWSWGASSIATASPSAAVSPVGADVSKVVGHQDHAIHNLVGCQVRYADGVGPPDLNRLESTQIHVGVQYLDILFVDAEHVVLEVPSQRIIGCSP
jgi:hypothetical protein